MLSSSINFQMSAAKNSLPPPPPARAHTHTHTPPSLTNTRRIARTHIDAPLLTSPCARSHRQLGLQLYLCKSCIMPPPQASFPPRRHTYICARTVPLRRTHAPNKKSPYNTYFEEDRQECPPQFDNSGISVFQFSRTGLCSPNHLKRNRRVGDASIPDTGLEVGRAACVMCSGCRTEQTPILVHTS